MTLQQVSNKVGRIIGFIADVEKHRAYAPEINTLGRWAEVLGMLPHERSLLFDLAGKERGTVPPDLADYLKQNHAAVDGIRFARDIGATDSDWNHFRSYIEFKHML